MKKQIITAFMLIMAMTAYAGGASEPQTGGTNSETATAQTETPLSGSRDGSALTWTQVPQNEIPGYFGSVAYGNGRFIAVGSGVGGGEGFDMAYSTDGIIWTDIRDKIPNGTRFESITFCGGKFFAYRWLGMAVSTDGENWTVVDYFSTMRDDIKGIAYGNGKYVLVTYGGRIMYSTDGITWTRAANSPFSQYQCIAYGNGKFVVASYGNRMAYSADGINWTTVAGTYGGIFGDIIFGDGKFVALDLGVIFYSTDGLTWTEVRLSELSDWYFMDSAYGGGKFVSATNRGRMAYSADGITWMPVYFDADSRTSIAYGNGRFVAVTSTWDWENARGNVPNSNRIAYSNLWE